MKEGLAGGSLFAAVGVYRWDGERFGYYLSTAAFQGEAMENGTRKRLREFAAALRFAARRARSTGGRVVLLRMLPDNTDAHWSGAREEISHRMEATLEWEIRSQ